MSTVSSRLVRAAASIAATAVVALTVWYVVQIGVVTLGASPVTANVASSGAAIALALSLSDIYLPIGGGPRTDVLRERPPLQNALDALSAAILAGVAGYALGWSGFTDWVGIALAAVVGYGSFVVRHREEYIARE